MLLEENRAAVQSTTAAVKVHVSQILKSSFTLVFTLVHRAVVWAGGENVCYNLSFFVFFAFTVYL